MVALVLVFSPVVVSAVNAVVDVTAVGTVFYAVADLPSWGLT